VAWQELTIRIAAAELPRAEALLRLAGADSLSISDGGDAPILEPAPGATPLWPEITLRALFAANADLGGIGAALGDLSRRGAAIGRISDEELADAARQTVRPVVIGPRLAIVPAEALAEAGDCALGLHMGLAFGTGQHATTRLCLEWLEREMRRSHAVLDFGCGTGVLALAALKLGAESATAIDNEAQALEAARQNAALNGLKARLRIGPPESLGAERFDLILANILARTLIELADAFAAHQAPGGRIALAGILDAEAGDVEQRYARCYEGFERTGRDGWCLLTGRRQRV